MRRVEERGKWIERREREGFAGVAVEGGWESNRQKESESGERMLNSKINKSERGFV